MRVGTRRVVPDRDFALVCGRQDQMFATLAGIVTGQAQVVDPAEMAIVDDTQIRAGWEFNHHRPRLLQVQYRGHVRRVGVAGEQHVPGATSEDQRGLVVLRASVALPLERAFHRDGGIEEAVGLYGALIVLVVLNAPRRFRRWEAALEFVLLRKRWRSGECGEQNQADELMFCFHA